MQPVLDDPDFRTAVGFAKGLAKQSGAKELSPLLLLCGFALADRARKLGAIVQDLSTRGALIDQAALTAGLRLSDEVESFDKETISTDVALRELLSTAGDSVVALIDALFKSIDVNIANPAKLMKSIDAILKSDGFNETVRFASSLARTKGIKDISAELLVAGAFFAYREGFLRKRPSVCAHLAAFEPSIKVLIEMQGWKLDTLGQEEIALPLAPSVEKLLKEGDGDSDLLIVALNVGLEAASAILLKKRIAYHEAGHAVIHHILLPAIGITQVTIIGKDGADGYTAYDISSPVLKRPTSREYLLDMICVSLAGRVSEQSKYGHDEIDAGALDDLEKATVMAWDAIARLGLDFDFGPLSLTALSKAGAASNGWLFDQAQRRLQEVLKEGLQRTEKLMAENWVKVEAVAQVLFEKKKLSEDELITIMGNALGEGAFEIKS